MEHTGIVVEVVVVTLKPSLSPSLSPPSFSSSLCYATLENFFFSPSVCDRA